MVNANLKPSKTRRTGQVAGAATVGASAATLASWFLTTKFGVQLPPGIESAAASLVSAALAYGTQWRGGK